MIRRYSELIALPTFKERYDYLRTNQIVAERTFGGDRCLNQGFYVSKEWKEARSKVIARDLGCDLACKDRPIAGKVIVHHMNPITVEDLVKRPWLTLDPEYLVCVSHMTHEAIHYGSEKMLFTGLVERRPDDQCPWKIQNGSEVHRGE